MSKQINNLNNSLEEQLHLNEKQDKIDNNLETKNKTIVGAINEIQNSYATAEYVDVNLKKTSGDLTNLQTNNKTNLVGAINELFQSANNGKELIATAIGEPLNSSDTFSAMSDDIKSLLSTFKTNMMNNGVSVGSGDKFKALIDKLKGLTEGEGNKGVQYAEGTYEDFTEYLTTSGSSVEVPYELNFTPTLIFVKFDYIYNSAGTTITNVVISNKSAGKFYMNYSLSFNIDSITSNSFSMIFSYGDNSNISFEGVTWYAIGVGEEDTTLRDALASILTEEGVSVTEEDDMASLISKVDSEFDRQVVPAGDAVAGDVLSGKTFINNTGQTITGTMANMSTHTRVANYVAWNTDSIYLGIPTGAYVNASSTGYPEVYIEKTRLDSNLVPGNIVSGKSICGVAGTAKAYPYPSWYSTSNTWIKGANMPSARNYCMSGFVNNKFYVLGGHDSNSAYNICSYYDPSNNKWTSLANSPYSYRDLGSAVIGTKIYGIGGVKMPGDEVGVTLIYDTSNNSWSTCAGMAEWSEGSNISAIVPVGTKIYVIGAAYNKYIQFLDTSSNTWTNIGSYMHNYDGYQYGGAGTAIGNNVYLFGNYRDINNYHKSTYMFNVSTKTWTAKATMPGTNCYSVAVQHNSKVHVLGGANSNTANWVYDPTANTWTTKTAMTTGKSYCPIGFSYDGKLFVTGGGNATTQIYIS